MVWSTSKKKEKYCETFWKRFREETENTEREELLNFKARLINELLIVTGFNWLRTWFLCLIGWATDRSARYRRVCRL